MTPNLIPTATRLSEDFLSHQLPFKESRRVEAAKHRHLNGQVRSTMGKKGPHQTLTKHKFGPVQVTNLVWVKQIYQLTRVVENCPFDNQPIHFNNRFPFMHGGSTNVTIGVVATIVLLFELQRQGSAGHEATDRLRELTGNGDGL